MAPEVILVMQLQSKTLSQRLERVAIGPGKENCLQFLPVDTVSA
jgi:hypothetical protein